MRGILARRVVGGVRAPPPRWGWTCAAPPTVLQAARRDISASFLVNLENPEAALAHVRETKQALEAAGKREESKHLHTLINFAINHYQLGDMQLARACATEAFNAVVLRKGPESYLTYFAAATAAKCTEGLAAELRAIEAARDEHSMLAATASSLRPATGGASIADTIATLDKEAARYQALADRLREAPKNGHLRHKRKGWDDRDSSSATGHRENHDRRKRSEWQVRRSAARQEGYSPK